MLASAALLAAAAAPAPAAYPARDVLNAFATACSGAEDTAVNLASAQAAGWERLAPGADTPVSRLVAQGKAALAKLAGEARMLDGAEYRKTVAGRTLYLAVSGVDVGGSTNRGCRLFDFAAPRAPTIDELANWAFREPADASEPSEGITKYTWSPGLKPGHMEMELFFIAPGRNPLPGFDTSGLTLVASAVEF